MIIKGTSNIAAGQGSSGGTSSSAPTTLQITKTYTIGFSNVQPLMVTGFNEGISEHTIVDICATNNIITSNSSVVNVGKPASTASISEIMKNSPFGIKALGKSIVYGWISSTGYMVQAPFNDNGTTKYGIQMKTSDQSTDSYYGLIIHLRCKPFKTQSGGVDAGTTARIKGTLKLLCWNINTNEYETIEWLNIEGQLDTGTNIYRYNGYIVFQLANNYILCGILEATTTPLLPDGFSYVWLTESDI